jgi:hypothetical protein
MQVYNNPLVFSGPQYIHSNSIYNKLLGKDIKLDNDSDCPNWYKQMIKSIPSFEDIVLEELKGL